MFIQYMDSTLFQCGSCAGLVPCLVATWILLFVCLLLQWCLISEWPVWQQVFLYLNFGNVWVLTICLCAHHLDCYSYFFCHHGSAWLYCINGNACAWDSFVSVFIVVVSLDGSVCNELPRLRIVMVLLGCIDASLNSIYWSLYNKLATFFLNIPLPAACDLQS